MLSEAQARWDGGSLVFAASRTLTVVGTLVGRAEAAPLEEVLALAFAAEPGAARLRALTALAAAASLGALARAAAEGDAGFAAAAEELDGLRTGAAPRAAEEVEERRATRSGFGAAGGAGLFRRRLLRAGSSGDFFAAELLEAASFDTDFTEPTADANSARRSRAQERAESPQRAAGGFAKLKKRTSRIRDARRKKRVKGVLTKHVCALETAFFVPEGLAEPKDCLRTEEGLPGPLREAADCEIAYAGVSMSAPASGLSHCHV